MSYAVDPGDVHGRYPVAPEPRRLPPARGDLLSGLLEQAEDNRAVREFRADLRRRELIRKNTTDPVPSPWRGALAGHSEEPC